MNPLSAISTEIEELQSGVALLGTSLQGIEQDLIPCREYSCSIVTEVLQALSGIMAGLSERRRTLNRVEYEIDQAKGQIRELTIRSKRVGVEDPLSAQKRTLAGLRHICQDLKSDLESIEHFRLNFKARLDRLKGSE